MITPLTLLNVGTTTRGRANLADLPDKFHRCLFLHKSLNDGLIIFVTGLACMPWELVRETGFELAGCTSHDRLIVATTMNLTGVAARTKTHGKIWNVFEDCHDRFPIISDHRY